MIRVHLSLFIHNYRKRNQRYEIEIWDSHDQSKKLGSTMSHVREEDAWLQAENLCKENGWDATTVEVGGSMNTTVEFVGMVVPHKPHPTEDGRTKDTFHLHPLVDIEKAGEAEYFTMEPFRKLSSNGDVLDVRPGDIVTVTVRVVSRINTERVKL